MSMPFVNALQALAGRLQGDPAQQETKLNPIQEALFRAWKQQSRPDDSGFDYDLRGAWLGGAANDPRGHLPDTWKKTNHDTLSPESMYYGQAPQNAGMWLGNDWYGFNGKVKKSK